MLADEALSAQVEASLVKAYPKVIVDSSDGEVFINVRGARADEKNILQKVQNLAQKVDGVKSIQVNIVPFIVED
jgi:copper chaperone CopZ